MHEVASVISGYVSHTIIILKYVMCTSFELLCYRLSQGNTWIMYACMCFEYLV